MKLGEVCLLTGDVVRLAKFYKKLLGIENGSSDPVHQTIIAEETMLTIYNDGIKRPETGSHIQLAFTVEDVDREYVRLKELGAKIASPPASRPWGARNMSFFDPDGNLLFLRSFPKEK
ncbi:MAG: VOC family protein [Provencibacterium sp.]|jgi:predicted enzyme related to lactoylglutathione lyase|nr:VOC family protein [Provencibacterium sp.]